MAYSRIDSELSAVASGQYVLDVRDGSSKRFGFRTNHCLALKSKINLLMIKEHPGAITPGCS